MTTATHYPGFPYSVDQLSKFAGALDFFTIMLKDKEIIHFTPSDSNTFRIWLESNNVADIKYYCTTTDSSDIYTT